VAFLPTPVRMSVLLFLETPSTRISAGLALEEQLNWTSLPSTTTNSSPSGVKAIVGGAEAGKKVRH